jgi:chaperonin GroES
MSIKPLYDKIVVKRVDVETTSAGGLILTTAGTEKPCQGVVLEVGSGKSLENGDLRSMSISVGDKVLFGRNSGIEAKIDGETLLIMREDDVLAILS